MRFFFINIRVIFFFFAPPRNSRAASLPAPGSRVDGSRLPVHAEKKKRDGNTRKGVGGWVTLRPAYDVGHARAAAVSSAPTAAAGQRFFARTLPAAPLSRRRTRLPDVCASVTRGRRSVTARCAHRRRRRARAAPLQALSACV